MTTLIERRQLLDLLTLRPLAASLAGLFMALGAVLPAQGFPQESDRTRSERLPLELRIETFQLSNGWRFLLLARHDAPVISFETWVDTGSRHDPPEARGLVHLMMSMLFMGSDRIGTLDWSQESAALQEVDHSMQAWLELEGREEIASVESEAARSTAQDLLARQRKAATSFADPGEFSRLLEDAGGAATLNAVANADSTRFVVSLPANQLELWCWLESERFARPVLREFYSTRDGLIDARLGELEAATTSALERVLLKTSYSAHPYRYPATGQGEGLAQLTRAAASSFLKANYGARNMTTAIVGDFDVTAISGMLERYFGALPAGPVRVMAVVEEPAQDHERRVEVELGAPAELLIGWHVPPFAHSDAPAVRIALRLLGYARSSRLERRLIRDDGSASVIHVNPALGGDELRGLAVIRAVPITGVTTQELERSIYAEIERLATDGPTEQELLGVKRAANAEYLRGLRDNASLASGLLEYDVKGGDWRGLFRTMDRLQEVQGEDVKRVLRTYFIESRRNVVTLTPPPSPVIEGQE